MAFCTKCGSELPESGVCSCGYSAPGTATAHATMRQEEGSSAPQPNVVKVQESPNPLITDSVAVIRGTLATKPQDAAIIAINSTAHTWAILGGVNILIAALAFMLIPGELIKGMFGDGGGYLGSSINDVMPFGALFGGGLLLALVSFAVKSVCVKGVYAIYSSEVSFVKVMNLVSWSQLVSSIATAGAIIFSFILAPVSLMLVFLGIIGSAVMLYTGIQKAASFKSSPFWAFLCVYAIDMIVLYLVGRPVIESILREALGIGSGSFSW